MDVLLLTIRRVPRREIAAELTLPVIPETKFGNTSNLKLLHYLHASLEHDPLLVPLDVHDDPLDLLRVVGLLGVDGVHLGLAQRHLVGVEPVVDDDGFFADFEVAVHELRSTEYSLDLLFWVAGDVETEAVGAAGGVGVDDGAVVDWRGFE